MADAPFLTGAVSAIIYERGFGFVHGDDGRDHFFHRSALRGMAFTALRKGQRVLFESMEADKGPRAVSVRPASAM
jgi:cold shock protein